MSKAREIAEERLAKGEVTEEEFEKIVEKIGKEESSSNAFEPEAGSKQWWANLCLGLSFLGFMFIFFGFEGIRFNQLNAIGVLTYLGSPALLFLGLMMKWSK